MNILKFSAMDGATDIWAADNATSFQTPGDVLHNKPSQTEMFSEFVPSGDQEDNENAS